MALFGVDKREFEAVCRNASMSEISAYYYALVGKGIKKEYSFEIAITFLRANTTQAREAQELIDVIDRNSEHLIKDYQRIVREVVDEINADLPFRFENGKLDLKDIDDFK